MKKLFTCLLLAVVFVYFLPVTEVSAAGTPAMIHKKHHRHHHRWHRHHRHHRKVIVIKR